MCGGDDQHSTGPGEVKGITINSVRVSSAVLSWRLPLSNGRSILGYRISSLVSGVEQLAANISLVGDMVVAYVSGLQPFTKYQLMVLAYNDLANGPASELVEMSTLAGG